MARKFIIALPGNKADNPNIAVENTAVHSDYATYMVAPNLVGPTVSTTYSTNTTKFSKYNSGYVKMLFTSNPASPPVTVTLVTHPHGFSYVPQCFAKYTIISQPSTAADIPPNGFGGMLPLRATGQSVGDNIFTIDAYADATNFYIVLRTNDSFSDVVDMEIEIKYYIFITRGL